MICMGAHFYEDQCHCQQFNQDPNTGPTYITPNTSQPYAISSSTHGRYHYTTPTYCQSTAIGPINGSPVPEFTWESTEPSLSFHNDHPPSTLLSGIAPEQGYSPPHSFESCAFVDTIETGSECIGQNDPGQGLIQDIIARRELSIEPEVSCSHFESSDLQTASCTSQHSAIYSPIYPLQVHPSGAYNLSGFANCWGHFLGQQNNAMTLGIEGLQIPIENVSFVPRELTDIRAARPPESTETFHTLANGVQSSYSIPYSYHGFQIQEPSTVFTMQISPGNTENQNQIPLLDVINGQDHVLGKCPHAKCQSGNTKIFTKFSEFRGHWYRTHEKRYSCLKCNDTVFGTDADLRRHSGAVHSDGPKEFTCNVECCNARAKEFTRKDRLKEHNEKWHGKYHCPMKNCPRGLGNGFRDQTLLDEHRRKSHG
ncbi:hypothetical protein MFRU_054g00060 [Monilinia fructicola]|nr:hypothetical protein MFRU_054g00060 [Monilinia fructicola]